MFTRGSYRLDPPASYCDEEGDWDQAATLAAEPLSFPATPWSWHGPQVKVTGPAWGGSFEIVDFHLRTGRYLLPEDRYQGAVLFLETSEELPPASDVYRVLMCMGERKLLQRFAGHTEPQHVIPSGGTVTVDGEAQQIHVTY